MSEDTQSNRESASPLEVDDIMSSDQELKFWMDCCLAAIGPVMVASGAGHLGDPPPSVGVSVTNLADALLVAARDRCKPKRPKFGGKS